MGEAKDQQGFDPTKPTEPEEKREKLAKAVVNVAAIVESDPNMIMEEKKVWQDTAKKPLESLAPGQNDKTASADGVKRAAGLLANNMEFPGSKSIKQIIQWVEKHL